MGVLTSPEEDQKFISWSIDIRSCRVAWVCCRALEDRAPIICSLHLCHVYRGPRPKPKHSRDLTKIFQFSVETQAIVVNHINVNYWKTHLFWMLNKNQSYSLKIEKIMYKPKTPSFFTHYILQSTARNIKICQWNHQERIQIQIQIHMRVVPFFPHDSVSVALSLRRCSLSNNLTCYINRLFNVSLNMWSKLTVW